MESILRYVSFIEGYSLLILLFVAMPLKYGADWPLAVQVVGLLHGILFILLCSLILYVAFEKSWPRDLTIFALLSSAVPFGMFALDRRLRNLG